jgi:hypothetical protein
MRGTLPGAGRKRFVANCKGLLQKEVLLFVKNPSHPAATGVAGHWRNLEHVARAGILAPRWMAAHIADAPLAKVPGRRDRRPPRRALGLVALDKNPSGAGRFE